MGLKDVRFLLEPMSHLVKAKVTSLTLEMYEKAILYYSKAEETGYTEASDRIAAVKEKMSALTQ